MSIEKLPTRPLQINSVSELKHELKLDLTQKEEEIISNEFRPFELAQEKAQEIQKKINEQSEEKLNILRELVNPSRDAKVLSEKKEKDLASELQGKALAATSTVEKKAQEILSPFEQTKKKFDDTIKEVTEKVTSAWEKLVTPIKFSWYSLWAYFGFKYGKEGLAALSKEKVEKTVEMAQEKLGGKKENLENSPETSGPLGVLEKIGIGIMGTGAFAAIKGALPNVGEGSGKSMLKSLGKNRALKLFGFSGLTLFGLGQLTDAVEDPDIKKQVGEMPTDTEGKKAWFNRVIDSSKNIAENTKESLKKLIHAGWDTANGEKLDQHFEKHKTRQGYVRLDEHSLYTDAQKELSLVGLSLEKMYYQQRAFFDTVLAGSAIASKGALIGTALKGPAIVMKVLGLLAPNFLIPAAIVGAIGANGLAMARNIQVPEKMTEEDIKDLVSIPNVTDSIRSHIPDFDAVNIDMKPVADNLEKFGTEIQNWHADTFLAKATETVKEWLVQDNKEVVNKKNITGLAYCRIILQEIERRESTLGKYEPITKKLAQLEEKIHRKEIVTEADIRELMETARGSDINVFPAEGHKAGKTLQWVRMRDGYEVTVPVNLCVNPTLPPSEQAKIAEDMIIEPKDPGIKDVIGGLGSGLRKQISHLGEAINLKKIQEASGIVDKLIAVGCGVFQFGKTVGIEYLGNLFPIPFDGEDSIWTDIYSRLTGEMTGQEFLVEYGQSIAPAFVIYGFKHGFLPSRKNFLGMKLLADTASVPFKAGKMMWEGGRKATAIGTLIYDRYTQGDIAGLLRDPLVRIKSGTIGHVQEKIGHNFRRMKIGKHLQEMGELNRLRAMLLEVKVKRDLHPTDGEIGKQELQKIQNFIAGPEKRGLREEMLHIKIGDTIPSVTQIDLHTLDEMIRRVESSQITLSTTGRQMVLEGEKTTKTAEITRLEAEMNMHRPGHPEYESRKSRVSALKAELGGIERGLKGIKHLRIAGKGGKAAALLGAIGGMAYIHGKAVDYYYGKSAEFDKGMPVDEMEFFGFEKDKKPKEFSPEKCDTPEEFNEKVIEIESRYVTPFEHLLDPNWIKNTSQSDIKGYISGIQKLHGEQVENMRKLVKANRGMMEKYWEEKGASKEVGEEVIPQILKTQSLSAFMFIHKKEGQFRMEYMDEDDIKGLCYEIIDSGWYARNVSNNEVVQKTAQIGETGLRVLPISGTVMDAKDAYQSFYRGNVGEGFANLGWCALGLGLDIFSVGTAGSLSRAARLGINIGQNIAQTGVGMAQGIITTAHRSESIKFSEL